MPQHQTQRPGATILRLPEYGLPHLVHSRGVIVPIRSLPLPWGILYPTGAKNAISAYTSVVGLRGRPFGQPPFFPFSREARALRSLVMDPRSEAARIVLHAPQAHDHSRPHASSANRCSAAISVADLVIISLFSLFGRRSGLDCVIVAALAERRDTGRRVEHLRGCLIARSTGALGHSRLSRGCACRNVAGLSLGLSSSLCPPLSH